MFHMEYIIHDHESFAWNNRTIKNKSKKKVFDRIGSDAYKWRFEIRKIKRK